LIHEKNQYAWFVAGTFLRSVYCPTCRRRYTAFSGSDATVKSAFADAEIVHRTGFSEPFSTKPILCGAAASHD